MIQSTSARQAKKYFTDALLQTDYYLDDQELNGEFQGRLAVRLGLKGAATRADFHALCENIHPCLGTPLTPRTKEARTTGYDINFHCPKSVSIVHVLSKDDHILTAFRECVAETMRCIEADSKTRVRKEGRQEDRISGELVWVDFIHQTARPLAGMLPDPHLHAHCYVFNATWDDTEQRIKAAQFRDIKRDMPYYQAMFHKLLSDRLIGVGYRVKRTDKSFELEGIPQQAISLFSKRTDEIGRIAKDFGITNPRELAELGARTRAKKQKGESMAMLKAQWVRQIQAMATTGQEDDANPVRFAKDPAQPVLDPKHCVEHALLHSFERVSVMQSRRVLEAAYRFGIGNSSVTVNAITECFNRDERIISTRENGLAFCTTKAVLREEQRMVRLAKDGVGKFTPFYNMVPELSVSGEQADAVRLVLSTSDLIAIIRGGAGTGKTTLMVEMVSLIEKTGKQVTVVAPTSNASRGVLREEGFKHADTVARLLTDKTMQNTLQGHVLLVDEAGLLGTRDMAELLELATTKNARIILVGDTHQHGSVVRGDALRILEAVGGIPTTEVSKIYRQQDPVYRSAVEDLAKGEILTGFDKLDKMGAIKTIDPLNPHELLVADYIKAVKKRKNVLVISPTHAHGEEVTSAIRQKLRQAGRIGKTDTKVDKLANLNLTQAQKADWRHYRTCQVIQFNQNLTGVRRASMWTVDCVSKNEVQLKSQQGQIIDLPLSKADCYDVLQKTEMALSKNDKIFITRNGFDIRGKRLNNGQELQVLKVYRNGQIKLCNVKSKATYFIPKEFGHLSHGYCITSYASQGKTVDEVFISQPAATFPATDAKQFYVSVSRAKYQVHIYTDDKDALFENASKMGDRKSAIELVGNKKMAL